MPEDFRSREFLLRHIRDTLDFYDDGVIDPNGGFRQNYLDDGTTFDAARKHLVSSCRMTFNYCTAERLFGESRYRDLWQRGVTFIRDRHRRPEQGGYTWTFSADRRDDTNHCYGLAFVLLMYAAVHRQGDSAAAGDLRTTWEIMERHFWLPDAGLYADEAASDWSRISDYRGQNANMHACEAAIFAYEATANRRFLDRAVQLAHTIAVEQADKGDGLVWEHFRPDLSLDWDYNRDDPANLYRPWGFQPGHQTEWSKLLLLLHRHAPENWMLERAQTLFDRALTTAWDTDNGGIFYGFAPDGSICDSNKYFWVQAESFAAAALLARATEDDRYWNWYERIWDYCWHHFVDHQHGAWYRVLTADNRKLSSEKSVAGAKCDYHNIGACVTALECV